MKSLHQKYILTSLFALILSFIQLSFAEPSINANYKQDVYTKGLSIGKINPDGKSQWENVNMKDGLAGDMIWDIKFSNDYKTVYLAHRWGVGAISVGNIKKDGQINWQMYSQIDGLPNNNAQALFIKDNVIYAATSEGLFIKNPNKKKFVKANLGPEFVGVNRVFVDDLGTIYLTTEAQGLFVKKKNEEKFINYYETEFFKHYELMDIYVDNETKDIYLATYGRGLVVGKQGKDGIQWTNYTRKDGLPCNIISSVYIDKHHTIYVGTYQGLGYSKDRGKNWVIFSNLDMLNPEPIQRIVVKDDAIYLAASGTTGGGLYASKDFGQTWKKYSIEDGLSTAAGMALNLDEKNNTLYYGGQDSKDFVHHFKLNQFRQ